MIGKMTEREKMDGMKLLALDPGLRTGLAALNVIRQDDPFWSDEIGDPLNVCDWVNTALEMQKVDLVVCENYIITGQTHTKTQQHYSLEIIGCVRWLCSRHGVEFVLQTPVERKGITNDILKKLGWYKGSKGDFAGHADDAARHLGTFLMTQQDQEFLRKVYA